MDAPRYDIDLFNGAYNDDPFPIYEEIRATGRVVWNDTLQAWMIPGFADCTRVLSDKGERFMIGNTPELTYWFDAPNMIMADGLDHERLRSCLVPLFTRPAVAKWEQRVREVVDDLLRPMIEESHGFDLIADFTMIPTIIVAEMLGVPAERYQDFRRWSHVITSNIAYGHENPSVRASMTAAAAEFNAYMASEVERHRHSGQRDLISVLLQSEMSNDEIISTALLLLLAGYDTTAKVMSNCVVALAQETEERSLVAANPSLIPRAIEEVLRWWGLLQMTPRFAVRDTVLADTKISAGDRVYCMLAAANRDPERWPDPARFDVQRDMKSHIAFGYGPHLCLGAALARLEIKVALERLLELAPHYRLRDIQWAESFMNRGPERGVVELGSTDAMVGQS